MVDKRLILSATVEDREILQFSPISPVAIPTPNHSSGLSRAKTYRSTSWQLRVSNLPWTLGKIAGRGVHGSESPKVLLFAIGMTSTCGELLGRAFSKLLSEPAGDALGASNVFRNIQAVGFYARPHVQI